VAVQLLGLRKQVDIMVCTHSVPLFQNVRSQIQIGRNYPTDRTARFRLISNYGLVKTIDFANADSFYLPTSP
jgi:hypothetical protein